MGVFIFHHHLNPGGVTRIIYSQIEALSAKDITVVTGATDGSGKVERMGAKLIVKEDLNYLKDQRYEPLFLHNLLRDYLWFLKDIVTKSDILHVHNLNLGKNPVLTFAFYLLAKEGYQVLNHAHDFAEDRPDNFDFLRRVIEKHFEENLQEVLYPTFGHYRFAVLNSFDFQRLEKYGVAKERITWLPNPVNLPFDTAKVDMPKARQAIKEALGLERNKKIVTYPVRVIKRKNIGEFILLSVLLGADAEFLVTQSPKNPIELKLYEKWIAFCTENNIRIFFEAGNKVNFEQLLMATDYCITTSYMEGFGMAFLEPWLLGTPVVGRNIGYVTKDFFNDGLTFPSLYEQILIEEKDFRLLEMEEQMIIIERAKNDSSFAQRILKENPKLSDLLSPVPSDLIQTNRELIVEKYSLSGYGNKLKDEYQKFS